MGRYVKEKKNLYLSQKEIDVIEAAIYNDTLSSLYEDIASTLYDQFMSEGVKSIVGENQYEHLEGLEHFIITSDGRLINTEVPRMMQLQFTGRELRAYADKNKVELKELFDKYGWEYDRDKILRTYRDNKWKIFVAQKHRDFYKAL